jgi:Uma2 family endonuclease
MIAAASAEKKPLRKLPDAVKPISWKDFQRRYLRREDGYKYEWVRGMVEKTPRSMNQDQYFILDNLLSLLDNLRQNNQNIGRLYTETDTFFMEDTHRRPDIAYFSEKQRVRMAYGHNEVPQFVIEIISSSDSAYRVTRKMQDYRSAKIQVVWQIFPELREVHIFRGGQMTVCSGDDLCSAAPALPEFTLTANQIFQKPPKPEGI